MKSNIIFFLVLFVLMFLCYISGVSDGETKEFIRSIDRVEKRDSAIRSIIENALNESFELGEKSGYSKAMIEYRIATAIKSKYE